VARGNPWVQHTPKARLRFDFLWGVANARIGANGKVFPPPPSAPLPERYMWAMHSFSSTTVFSFLRVNCCKVALIDNGFRFVSGVLFSCQFQRWNRTSTGDRVINVSLRSSSNASRPPFSQHSFKQLKYSLELAQGFFDLSVSRQVRRNCDSSKAHAYSLSTRPRRLIICSQGGNFKIHVLQLFPHEFGRVEQLEPNLVLLSPPL
jgi:hypothetical protein